jgi:putative transposase
MGVRGLCIAGMLSVVCGRFAVMLAGRRFRVEFTEDQAVFAEQIGAACRAVWNTGLEQRCEYRRRGAWMNYQPQAHELAEAKVEHPWLARVPGHCCSRR